jgi:hypothetical protein
MGSLHTARKAAMIEDNYRRRSPNELDAHSSTPGVVCIAQVRSAKFDQISSLSQGEI